MEKLRQGPVLHLEVKGLNDDDVAGDYNIIISFKHLDVLKN
jgi:hypothetical protein